MHWAMSSAARHPVFDDVLRMARPSSVLHATAFRWPTYYLELLVLAVSIAIVLSLPTNYQLITCNSYQWFEWFKKTRWSPRTRMLTRMITSPIIWPLPSGVGRWVSHRNNFIIIPSSMTYTGAIIILRWSTSRIICFFEGNFIVRFVKNPHSGVPANQNYSNVYPHSVVPATTKYSNVLPPTLLPWWPKIIPNEIILKNNS